MNEQPPKEPQIKLRKHPPITDDPERINYLIKKEKKLLGSFIGVGNFDEPILILLRRSGQAEFFENAVDISLTITHSDGEQRVIWLNDRKLISFPMGKKKIKGYICHEDIPTPLPEDPLLTTELTGVALDKTLNDIRKWKSEELKQQGNLFWKIALGACAIIGMYILYKLMFPGGGEEVRIVEKVVEVTQTTLPNIKIN